MNTLIVLAHPNKDSFNHQLADVAKKVFSPPHGFSTVIDLYDTEFASLHPRSDFRENVVDRGMDYKVLQKSAFQTESFANHIAVSQNLVMESDLIIFQFPLWWFSMPAIMRSWIEKVFTFDFAYQGREKRWFSNGPFKGKRAMLSFTTSGSERIYRDDGINGDISRILWPIHNGIFNFCGLSVLPPFICWGSDTRSIDIRPEYQERYQILLNNINNVDPLSFHPLEKFTDDYVLRGEFGSVYEAST